MAKASDYLVVEDENKPSTWHLQVKQDGKPDHKLMGDAKAALTSPNGFRGNKYEGPNKAEAISKLKALYKSENLPWMTQSAAWTVQNFRHEMKDGKKYLVVPGVPVREIVMNNYLVPADEIGHLVGMWNGSPITLRHPKLNNGSVNVPNPDVPIIGRFYNASFDGKKLSGEYWLDDGILQAQAPTIHNKILKGEGIETSTGYWADEEMTAGTFENKAYDLIHRNLRPDHIAILPDEVGACSMQDGCGVNRNSDANYSCPMGEQCPIKKADKKGVSMNIQDLVSKLSGKGIKVKVNQEEGKDPSFEVEETAPAPQSPAAPALFTDAELAALKSLAASAPVLQNAAQFAQAAVDEAKQRKAGLIATIKTNSANPLADADLENMNESALVKLNAHLNTNFMALSGVTQNADENFAMPPSYVAVEE